MYKKAPWHTSTNKGKKGARIIEYDGPMEGQRTMIGKVGDYLRSEMDGDNDAIRRKDDPDKADLSMADLRLISFKAQGGRIKLRYSLIWQRPEAWT